MNQGIGGDAIRARDPPNVFHNDDDDDDDDDLAASPPLPPVALAGYHCAIVARRAEVGALRIIARAKAKGKLKES